MTETTKEILGKYQVRKTKKQKTAFIAYVKQLADRWGYDCTVEKGSFGARNIVIGNPDRAKVLYTAHYDTCFILSLIPDINGSLGFVISLLPQILYLVLLYLLLGGPANKHTANDNTSGVTTVLDIMKELPEDQKDKVAFVLFDLEEAGLFGSSAFASKHKAVKKNTLVMNFDCVSDGETVLFVLKRTTKQYATLLENAFLPTPDITVDITAKAFYPSDNAAFNGGIGVAALKKSKVFGTLYMDRIHTNKDVIYREENIRFLTSGAIKLVQML